MYLLLMELLVGVIVMGCDGGIGGDGGSDFQDFQSFSSPHRHPHRLDWVHGLSWTYESRDMISYVPGFICVIVYGMYWYKNILHLCDKGIQYPESRNPGSRNREPRIEE